MYLRYEGDSGFSTRNPQVKSNGNMEFRLSNGQIDLYPKSWTYPLPVIKEALLYFMTHSDLPTQVGWHDDSK